VSAVYVCVRAVLTGKNAADGFHLVNGRAATRVTSVGGCARAPPLPAARGGDYLILRRETYFTLGTRRDEPRRSHALWGGDDRW